MNLVSLQGNLFVYLHVVKNNWRVVSRNGVSMSKTSKQIPWWRSLEPKQRGNLSTRKAFFEWTRNLSTSSTLIDFWSGMRYPKRRSFLCQAQIVVRVESVTRWYSYSIPSSHLTSGTALSPVFSVFAPPSEPSNASSFDTMHRSTSSPTRSHTPDLEIQSLSINQTNVSLAETDFSLQTGIERLPADLDALSPSDTDPLLPGADVDLRFGTEILPIDLGQPPSTDVKQKLGTEELPVDLESLPSTNADLKIAMEKLPMEPEPPPSLTHELPALQPILVTASQDYRGLSQWPRSVQVPNSFPSSPMDAHHHFRPGGILYNLVIDQREQRPRCYQHGTAGVTRCRCYFDRIWFCVRHNSARVNITNSK